MQNSKRGKLAFEIQLQDKGQLLVAESEVELDEWVTALKRAVEYEDRQLLGDKMKDKGNIDFLKSHLQYGNSIIINITLFAYIIEVHVCVRVYICYESSKNG